MANPDRAAEGAALAVCLTTAAGDGEAATISRALVAEGIAACVNRIPVRSTYRWEGEVRDDAETLLLVKVPVVSVERLRERLQVLSSYDVPEFVVLDASQVSASYLAWALSACGVSR